MDDDRRMQLTADEQVRIAALNAAVAYYGNKLRLPELITAAERIENWIFLGELPKPAPGLID